MDPVQAHVDAYDARNIERFVAAYAPDVVITGATRRAIMSGQETTDLATYGLISRALMLA
jgi:hypothetical protein